MRIVLYIAGKDLLLSWRDRLGFFWWMIGFPLLIAVLIGTIFAGVLEGPSKPMTVAVVDEAASDNSRDYIRLLASSGSIRVQEMPRLRAQEAVRQGKVSGFVLLRKGFHVSPAIFFGSRLRVAVGMDPAHQAELAYVEATLNETAIRYLRERWLDPPRRPEIVEDWLSDLGRRNSLTAVERKTVEGMLVALDRFLQPASTPAASRPGARIGNVEVVEVDAELRPQSAFEVCFPIGIAWGLIGLAAEFAMAIVREREIGTLLRLRAAPLSRVKVLAGSGLACFVGCVGVMALLLAVGHFVFGVRLQNPAALGLAAVCIALGFVGVTIFLTSLGRTESAVGGAAWAVLLILSMLGGGMVPQIFMPGWLEMAGQFSPVKWAIRSLEGGIWRGFSTAEMFRPCAILVAEGAVFAIAGALLLRRFDR